MERIRPTITQLSIRFQSKLLPAISFITICIFVFGLTNNQGNEPTFNTTVNEPELLLPDPLEFILKITPEPGKRQNLSTAPSPAHYHFTPLPPPTPPQVSISTRQLLAI